MFTDNINVQFSRKQQMVSEIFATDQPFKLEAGGELKGLRIQYTLYGSLNNDASNVIWILHALTANSRAAEWWDGLVGPGKLFDPDKYLIVCANNLGSCYGTTGPAEINPDTGSPYGDSFPLITIRDMARAHDMLRRHLGINQVFASIGGSMGGQIALEWAIEQPDVFHNIIPIAANARHSAWGIAFNEAQRMAMKNNPNGLAAARAIALLSYRSYDSYVNTQTDADDNLDNFRASSYQQYQGKKLVDRFDSDSYYTLSKAMDTHNVGRGRGTIENALRLIKARTLIIGISSDVLFPVSEQKYLREYIPGAELSVIDSKYGHDGFLLEYNFLNGIISDFLFM